MNLEWKSLTLANMFASRTNNKATNVWSCNMLWMHKVVMCPLVTLRQRCFLLLFSCLNYPELWQFMGLFYIWMMACMKNMWYIYSIYIQNMSINLSLRTLWLKWRRQETADRRQSEGNMWNTLIYQLTHCKLPDGYILQPLYSSFIMCYTENLKESSLAAV